MVGVIRCRPELFAIPVSAVPVPAGTCVNSVSNCRKALDYEAGDALGVWPRNDPAYVAQFLDRTGLDGDQTVNVGGQTVSLCTTRCTNVWNRQDHAGAARPGPAPGAGPIWPGCWIPPTAPHSRPGSGDAGRSTCSPTTRSRHRWRTGSRCSNRLCPDNIRSRRAPGEPAGGPAHGLHRAIRPPRGPGTGVRAIWPTGPTNRRDLGTQRSASFKPPGDSGTPMIAIGPGTGIAPLPVASCTKMRAEPHRQQLVVLRRAARGRTDFYYREEFEQFHADGLLTQLDLALLPGSGRQSVCTTPDARTRRAAVALAERGEPTWRVRRQGRDGTGCRCGVEAHRRPARVSCPGQRRGVRQSARRGRSAMSAMY